MILKNTFFSFAIALSVLGCKSTTHKETDVSATANPEILVPSNLKWSERMLLSEMERVPQASMLDFVKKPKWSYTNGLVLSAAARVYEATKKQQYYDYIYAYADEMIDSTGTIATYKFSNLNLDMIKSGDVLLFLYPITKEDRFLTAMQTLEKQMEAQPKTSDGGYWHKQIYPYQMWLDGLYMAEPFLIKYAQEYITDNSKVEKIYEDAVHQFDLIQKHSLDPETGLLYHGWDESMAQKWADKTTGTSPHFWSRAMGWYGMALVDVLDFLPESHPGRARLISYLNQYAEAVTRVQHKSGLWYQILDQGDREGNYLEASGSAMFCYAFAKGARKGYLPQKYMDAAQKAYSGIIAQLITVEDNGLVNLNQVCGVAGLGGNPYRDGSYEYYVNEIIRSNDPKGTGPFIMASLELDK